MSAHRIKIKLRRKAGQQAAWTSNSPITPSDIFGSTAIDVGQDDLEFPFSQEQCPWYEPTHEDFLRAPEKHRQNTNSAQGAPRPLCESDMDTEAAAALSPAHAPIPPTPGQSTGPRSPAGKARSSHNALKHGLSMPAGCSMTFLPHEDSDGHTLLLLQFNQQFVPMTGAETELVREIVDSLWLARRARDLQTSALETGDLHALALYLRYETAHQRAHNATIKTLLTVQKDRRLRNQNHEEWDEPVLWGDLDFAVMPNPTCPEPAMSSESPTTATTSASPADSDSSFRNAGFRPWSEMTLGVPNAHQAASGNTIEEVKPAA